MRIQVPHAMTRSTAVVDFLNRYAHVVHADAKQTELIQGFKVTFNGDSVVLMTGHQVELKGN
jgi:hypothetical protein